MILVCVTLARSEDDVSAGTAGTLLLEGNRVIEGRLTPHTETYSVEQKAGTVIVPRAQVRFVGTDLHSIYVHLQDTLPKKPQADEHVDLARWCIGYKLIPEARFELQAALETDPSREDIRRNLHKLDSLLKRPPPEAERVKPETPAQRLAKGTAGIAVDVESLGGLSREAGQEFTRRIQPILMHNCTASACHGPRANTTFKLNLVSQGAVASRSTTEKNLLALLPYIDQDNPKEGKLWKLLKTNHGAQGHSIFLGTKGKDQLETFQGWLKSLSPDDEPAPTTVIRQVSPWASLKTPPPIEQKPRWRKGGPQVASKKDEAPAPEVLVSPPQEEPVTSTKPRGTATAQIKRPKSPKGTVPAEPDVEPIASKERPVEIPELPPEDPFNPDEFNSRQRIKQRL